MPENVTFYVISYDISSDKIRRKVANALEDYGRRVQYSVFECRLSKRRIKTLYARLAELCTEPEDSIRIYTICENCVPKIRTIGIKKESPGEESVIII